ncbi:MAG: helix-turn-helix transcriptional regulator [Chitinophagaceae bacterium]|nr:helix-turn-helix transcriptional regulator [Chitinophagaceae bacterium]
MWLSRMPLNQSFTSVAESFRFRENILFSEKIYQSYHCDEHYSGLGLFAMTHGVGQFNINSGHEELGPGECVVINSQSRLSMETSDEYSYPVFLLFHSELPGIVAGSLFFRDEQLLDHPAQIVVPDLSILERVQPLDEKMSMKLNLLTSMGGGSSSFAAMKTDAIVRSILEDIFLKYNLDHRLSSGLPVLKRSTRLELYKRLCRAKDLIDANYYQDLTLDVLAEVACMNSQHFLRSFKNAFNQTPHRYLMHIRLENTKRLLLSGSMTVQEIARACGWESLPTFSRLFKLHYGICPTKLRKSRSTNCQF